MLNWLIDASLRHRALVILAAALFAVVGVFSLQQLDIDAFPDTTPVMIQINTVAPSLSSEEIERQITFPVEQAINGLPGLDQLRSISKFGLSQVVVIFDDGIDIYFARQLINERLSTVVLPDGIGRPQMGPISTGLGEVFHYVLIYVAFGDGFWTYRTESRLGVCPTAFRRRNHDQCRAFGGNNARRNDSLQHADGTGVVGEVPR